MNISSLVVDVRPEHLAAVQRRLAARPGVEIHAATPAGKLIVTVEADAPDADRKTTDTFAHIAAVEGVMSVALVYHHFEPDPEQEAADGTPAKPDHLHAP